MPDATFTGRRHAVLESELPSRYATGWRPAFVDRALGHCRPEMTILDVGGGARPTLPREVRPASTRYIGLDPDERDLASGDYDERILGSAATVQAALVGNVDVIVSWNVLEHVPDLKAALACFHSYLRPGGVLLAHFSGRWALFAIGARLMPHPVRVRLMVRLIGATADDHFPTYYDRCSARQIRQLMDDWQQWDLEPHYRGAGYFAFSRLMTRIYLAYETVAMRYPQLATHYTVCAVR